LHNCHGTVVLFFEPSRYFTKIYDTGAIKGRVEATHITDFPAFLVEEVRLTEIMTHEVKLLEDALPNSCGDEALPTRGLPSIRYLITLKLDTLISAIFLDLFPKMISMYIRRR